MKRVAKEMLSNAQEVAIAIQQRLGLPAVAGLDDRLLNSFIIVSTKPDLRKPGQWFEYLGDEGVKRTLRATGIIEVILEIPPRKREILGRSIEVRLSRSPRAEREEFVSENLRPPFSDELQGILARIAEIVSSLGYSFVGPHGNPGLEDI